MFPEIVIIEEEKKRRREAQWEPIPLHAPSPLRRRPERPERKKDSGSSRSNVIIIDISDYSESSL